MLIKRTETPKDLPRILVCLATKNDAEYIDKFLSNLETIDYPHDKLRFVIEYGKSVDFTLEKIVEFFSKRDFEYEIYHEPYMKKPIESAFYISEIYNEFIKLLKDEDYLLFVDSDISSIPSNLIRELLKVNKDVVAPYVYIEGKKNAFFDTYVFRTLDNKKFSRYNPPGEGTKVPLEVLSIGTLYLCKRQVIDAGASFENPCQHLQFCKNARKLGFKIWTLPYLIILHRDLESEGDYHLPIEWYVQRGILPMSEYEKVK